jgi:excisionase family DNA binding protein
MPGECPCECERMHKHKEGRFNLISKKIEAPLAPILVSKRDAARLLNLCVRTIEQLIRHRQLRAKRVGKRVLLLREDLETFARETGDRAVVS